MIYTAKEGVERRTKEKVLTAELIIVPLIMFGVTAYGLMGSPGMSTDQGSGDSNGSTLGTSTELSPPAGSSSPTTDEGSTDPQANSAEAAGSTGSSTAANSSSPKASASQTGSSPSQPPEGGRGGEDSSGGDSCPCQTVGDVLRSLSPPPAPVPVPQTSTPSLTAPSSGTL